ncbi:hypothetical protein [Pyrobaculum aerophilum]|nr:hypothetical protein [Pyrobaculum aerophilum]MCX8137011.1 hypothetical protein [Pyrobaculum aerophilum]
MIWVGGLMQWFFQYMARRLCPQCGKVVEEVVAREGDLVVKRCPSCGYVFIKYTVRATRLGA